MAIKLQGAREMFFTEQQWKPDKAHLLTKKSRLFVIQFFALGSEYYSLVIHVFDQSFQMHYFGVQL